MLLQKLREGCTDTLPPSPAWPELLSTTYRSTRAANWRANLYVVLHNKRSLALTTVFILLLSLWLPLPAFSPNDITNVVIRLAAATVLVAIWNIILLAFAIRMRLPTAKTIRTCTSSFTAEGVCDVTPDGRRLVPWRKITEIREHKGDIHVWFGLSGIFIPREAFNDVDEARRFVGQAVELWRSNRSYAQRKPLNTRPASDQK